MVPTKHEEVLWIFDLIAQKKNNALQALLPTIYIISEENVICGRGNPPYSKKAEEIVKLAMYVTADLDWSLKL